MNVQQIEAMLGATIGGLIAAGATLSDVRAVMSAMVDHEPLWETFASAIRQGAYEDAREQSVRILRIVKTSDINEEPPRAG